MDIILDKVRDIENQSRINNVLDIKEYMLRNHKVLNRPNFEFKGKTFETSKIVFNSLKSVVSFHTSYLLGNPVSVSGDPEVVSEINKLYKKGGFNNVDYGIVYDLYKYGDAFEYIYVQNGVIKSRLIANEDSYPIYNDRGEYEYFIEHWEDFSTGNMYDIVYYPKYVEKYENNIVKERYANITGLPIHYSSLDKSLYRYFGDTMLNDLIPIMDNVENLLSKLDDSITTLSMNPLGVSIGQLIEGNIPKDMVGATLNLEDGGDFKYVTAMLDYNSIKLELDSLLQQFYTVACVPSVVMGQSNIANVSEISLKLLFNQADSKAKQTINVLKMGMFKRFEYILNVIDKPFTDEQKDSLDVNFNINRPLDTTTLINELKTQYDMGAISLKTIIDISPYTTDTSLELERIQNEKVDVKSTLE